MHDPHAITDEAALEALYPPKNRNSLLKVRRDLDAPSIAFIERSPFLIMSTRASDGRAHGTPRGDAPGFCAVLSSTELALPDRKGNNRLDGLRDILRDPQVALLFLIPGVGETLRVHGRATITTDPALRARFVERGAEPATVLRIAVEEVFMQCPKALVRSRIWAGMTRPEGVPTAGQLIASAARGEVDAAAYDREAPARTEANLY